MPSHLYYAGIGSRKTPETVLDYMRRLAARLAANGWVLRSGAAKGADAAFELGCDSARGAKEIWMPWVGFNDHRDSNDRYASQWHIDQAAAVHPAFATLGRGPKALHARNVGQILGADGSEPSAMVVCWTPDGCESEASRTRDTGGTGTAVVLAHRCEVPVFNLANEDAKDRLYAFVREAMSARQGPSLSARHGY